MRSARSHLGWGWAGLGLAGSVLVTLAGADLVDRKPVRWWFHPGLPGGHDAHTVMFFAGIAVLCAAWLGLGRRLAHAPGTRPRDLVLIGALWCIPLALAPSIFSRDMYSYLADGSILHHGLDPYARAPSVLAQLHQSRLLDAVSPFWRHTTAPYGPAFLGITSLIAAVAGPHLVGGVLLMRLPELLGVALLATFVPRLARALGADPARATWLAVISPLVLLELVAAGHNDALMAGLLVAAVTLAVGRRPLLAVAVCALAATVKLPAAAGIVFIAISWVREDPRNAARIVGLCTVLTAAVLLLVSLATALGLDWISGSLSTPAKVRLAITPSTALGYSIASVMHAFGASVSSKAIESAVATVALALTAGLGVVLCWRLRSRNLVWYLGLLLLASVLGGPAAWPWYAIWGLALIACCAPAQRWQWLPIVLAATAFLIRADGQLVLPRQAAPVMLALYLAAAAALWRRAMRRPTLPPTLPPTLSTPEFAR